jgi:hypothetical protein
LKGKERGLTGILDPIKPISEKPFVSGLRFPFLLVYINLRPLKKPKFGKGNGG